MKRLHFVPLLAILAAVFIFSKADSPNEYANYRPVFMKRADLEKSVVYINVMREMENPGKIYIKGNTIYINEKYKGVHIIDNSNPANPVQTGYITVPGCIDMAVKGNMIYLDNAVDFVAFNMDKKQVTRRIKNYFPPHTTAPDGSQYWRIPEGMVLVNWISK